MTKPKDIQRLYHPDKSDIAYVESLGSKPTVIFLGGFNSSMAGIKATYLEQVCQQEGRSYIRFDYRGHGNSSGKFWEHTITDWIADAALVIDQHVKGDVILVGSSMGVWILCHMLKRFPKRVLGCVGIASAPDFTRSIPAKLDASQQLALQAGQIVNVPTEYNKDGYPITLKLIEEGKKQAVLGSKIKVNFPVRLLHGSQDATSPWQLSVELLELFQGEDIQLTLIKGGDHQLSEPSHLAIIAKTVFSLTK